MHRACDCFDATPTLVARSPSTSTWAAQQYTERRWLDLGSASKALVAKNSWRKLASGAPTKTALGMVEINVEREYDTPISKKSTAKNHAMRAMTSNVLKMKACLASWLAPNVDLSRYLRHLRPLCGNASTSALMIEPEELVSARGSKTAGECGMPFAVEKSVLTC